MRIEILATTPPLAAQTVSFLPSTCPSSDGRCSLGSMQWPFAWAKWSHSAPIDAWLCLAVGLGCGEAAPSIFPALLPGWGVGWWNGMVATPGWKHLQGCNSAKVVSLTRQASTKLCLFWPYRRNNPRTGTSSLWLHQSWSQVGRSCFHFAVGFQCGPASNSRCPNLLTPFDHVFFTSLDFSPFRSSLSTVVFEHSLWCGARARNLKQLASGKKMILRIDTNDFEQSIIYI